jgi:signal peptidase I
MVKRVVAVFVLFNIGAWVVFAQFEHTVKAYGIPSSGMEPALHCAPPSAGCEGDANDRVFVLRFHPSWTPDRGDIIVFKTPPEAKARCGAWGTFVKRLIGLPGETVEVRIVRGDGVVYINGRKLEEPYLRTDRLSQSAATHPTKLPPGEYFMLGDNRSQSCDSRVWGSVPERNLVGPVVAFYWPLDRFGLL